MNRILWADDEIDLLQPYVIYLNQKGYEVLTANNGQDAIDITDHEALDIVFLDEQMPGLSGLETLQIIKDKHPSLPVVMITKSEEEGVMEQAIGQKIADYLIKPVNPSQILLCLKKHVHEKSIVSEQTEAGYRQEFSDITYMIDTAETLQEWQAVQRTLSQWEIRLGEADSAMQEMLDMQRKQANAAFAKFVQRGYLSWLKDRSVIGDAVLSPDVFKKTVFPVGSGQLERFCFPITVSIQEPLDHVLIFVRIESARGIYETASGTDKFSCGCQDFPLPYNTSGSLFRRPFDSGLRIPAEHTFTGAWSICKYSVKTALPA